MLRAYTIAFAALSLPFNGSLVHQKPMEDGRI